MKKLLLLIGLVVLLTPMFASADVTKLACDCVKHNHKDPLLAMMGQPLHKEQKQCPSIPTIFYIDDEEMKFYGDLWHLDYDVSLDITTKNLKSELRASGDINDSFKGRLGVYKIDLNKDLKLNFLWDDKPPKKRYWVERKYNCKVLSTIQSMDPFEAKQQLCEKLGFPIGSQENGNCVLKIFEIESNLKQKEESAGGQLTEADKLIRQQRLNQSLMLMQQGLKLMSPPQPKLNCRNTITGWACY